MPLFSCSYGALEYSGCVSLRFVDNALSVAERYPANPNGSSGGITGLCNADGRVTIDGLLLLSS